MKTIRFILILSTLIISSSSIYGQNWNKYSVLFGERANKIQDSTENTIRIFIDQEGFIYPDLKISDKKLKRKNSSISDYLKANESELNALCDKYSINKELDNNNKLELLNNALAKKYNKLINSKVKNYENTYFLIHGYRKRAYGKAKFLSVNDNKYLKSDISKNGKTNLFVEIYWDSKFITPIQGYKYKGFKLMEQSAIPNAINVGTSLRRIIPYIQVDTLNIVTHSLGAILTSELLFNTKHQVLPTPAQNVVNICLMAPAIGSEYFKNYYHRNSSFDFQTKDNYHLFIIQNKNDFVLNKSFEWGVFKIKVKPTEYGNTSLGCNYNNDSEKLLKMFNEEFKISEPPEFIQIETYNNGNNMKCHLISCYSSNSKFSSIKMFEK